MKRKDIRIGGQYMVRGRTVQIAACCDQYGLTGEYLWTCEEIYPHAREDGTYRRTSAYAFTARSSDIDCTLETYKRRQAHRDRLAKARQNKLDKLTAKAVELQYVLQGLANMSMGESTAWMQCKTSPHGDIVVSMTPHAANCLMHTTDTLKRASKL